MFIVTAMFEGRSQKIITIEDSSPIQTMTTVQAMIEAKAKLKAEGFHTYDCLRVKSSNVNMDLGLMESLFTALDDERLRLLENNFIQRARRPA